jgi:hypothetical protein
LTNDSAESSNTTAGKPAVVSRSDPTADVQALADLLTPMAVRVAATLGIADCLAVGPMTAADVARLVGADADALERLLRHLVTVDIVRSEDGRFALAERGEVLRSDHPSRFRERADIGGSLGRAALSVVQLLHSVRTGEAGYPVQFGRDFWDDIAAARSCSEAFDAEMSHDVARWAPPILAAYDWGRHAHVVDVGGGDGTLLAELLRAHPRLHGTVFEMPRTADVARAKLAAAGIADRADVVAGSFFDPLPAGADAYVLTAVIHNWPDDAATTILRRCGEAADTSGRVLVIEKIGRDGVTPSTAVDLGALALHAGKERSRDALIELGERAGLTTVAVHPAANAIVIVELLL